ncbi:MAG TPA: hypothetical protein VGH99_17600 [Pseudonocardia sp.]
MAASPPRLAAGTTGRVVGPLGVTIPFRVTAVDEARRSWSWRVSVGPLTVALDHGVQDRPGGSRTWLRIDAPLPVAVGYLSVAQLGL